MSWSEAIIAVHTSVTDQVSHAARLKSERYFVWQEDGGNDDGSENRHSERAVTGTTDLSRRWSSTRGRGPLRRRWTRPPVWGRGTKTACSTRRRPG